MELRPIEFVDMRDESRIRELERMGYIRGEVTAVGVIMYLIYMSDWAWNRLYGDEAGKGGDV